MSPRPPLLPASDATESGANYVAWLRAKLAKSVSDCRPLISHDEVERRMTERIAELKAKHAGPRFR